MTSTDIYSANLSYMIKNLEYVGFKSYENAEENSVLFFFYPHKNTKIPTASDVRVRIDPKEPEKVQMWAYDRKHQMMIRKTIFVTRNLKKQAEAFVLLVNKIRKI